MAKNISISAKMFVRRHIISIDLTVCTTPCLLISRHLSPVDIGMTVPSDTDKPKVTNMPSWRPYNYYSLIELSDKTSDGQAPGDLQTLVNNNSS